MGKAKKSEHHCYWITGSFYETKLFIEHLLDKFKAELVLMDNDDKLAEHISSRILESSMFGKGVSKVVWVRGLPENYGTLCDLVDKCTSSRILVIDAPLCGKIGNKSYNASNSALVKKIKTNKCMMQFRTELDDQESIGWLNNISEKLGVTIEEQASLALSKRRLGYVDSMWSDVQKLSTYIGNRRKITQADVEECCGTDYSFSNWDFIDKLVEGDCTSCIDMLDRYFMSDENFFYQTEGLLGSIIYKLETMLFIKDSCGTLSFDSIKNSLSEFKKNSAAKYSDAAISATLRSDSFRSSFSKIGTVKIAQMISIVYWTRIACRMFSGRENIIKLALLRMIETLCGSISYQSFFESWSSKCDCFGPERAT